MDIRDYQTDDLEKAIRYKKLESRKNDIYLGLIEQAKRDNPCAMGEIERIDKELFDLLGVINKINQRTGGF